MTPSTVFIIDDEPSVRKSLAWLLGSVNLPTKSFATGEEFLQSPDAAQPGCVLLDLRLPGISGLTVLERLSGAELSPRSSW